jgi:predicted amidophosphoribosyltransferase
LTDLTRRALTTWGPGRGIPGGPVLQVRTVLRHNRRVGDQSDLDARNRWVNLSGAMSVRKGTKHILSGASCLVVDDILTTGATLCEAVRALRAAGAQVLGAVTLVVTPPPRGVSHSVGLH